MYAANAWFTVRLQLLISNIKATAIIVAVAFHLSLVA